MEISFAENGILHSVGSSAMVVSLQELDSWIGDREYGGYNNESVNKDERLEK